MASIDVSDDVKGIGLKVPPSKHRMTHKQPKGSGSLGTESAVAMNSGDLKNQSRRVTGALERSPETKSLLAKTTKRGVAPSDKNPSGANPYEGMTLEQLRAGEKPEQISPEDAAAEIEKLLADTETMKRQLKAFNVLNTNAPHDLRMAKHENDLAGIDKASDTITTYKAIIDELKASIAENEARIPKLKAFALQREPDGFATAAAELGVSRVDPGRFGKQNRDGSYIEAGVIDYPVNPINTPEGDPDLRAAIKKQAANMVMSERLANEAVKPVEAKVQEINEARPGTDNDLTLQKVSDVKNVTKDSKAARKADSDKRGRKNIISALSKNLPGM